MTKILIVEDERILTEMYKEVLASEGFKVETAQSTEEALEILQREDFDLILLDILLPRKDGLELIEELKKMRDKIPKILAFSNFDSPKAKERAHQLGIKEYLLKTDYTPLSLVKKIREVLES